MACSILLPMFKLPRLALYAAQILASAKVMLDFASAIVFPAIPATTSSHQNSSSDVISAFPVCLLLQPPAL